MVRRTSPNRKPRSGVAAVELAFLLIPLLIFWLCVIELSRMIQVDQIVTSATRDAARTAGLALSIRADPSTGLPKSYSVTVMDADPAVTGSTALSIEEVVKGHLAAHKIKVDSGIGITFTFLTGDLARTQPHQGEKTDRFRLRVVVPYNNFRWLSITGSMGGDVSAEVQWRMLVDDPFNVNENIPKWNGGY